MNDSSELQISNDVRVQWRSFWIALAGVSAIFLLLENSYWFRSGDGDVFLAVARNMVTGKGYTFNGQPFAIHPPLWPLILAGAMKVSSSFAFLKLIPLLSTIGFLAIGYWILLRFTTPRRSAIVIVLSALCQQIYPQAINFFSDGLFCLVAAAALLLAMQINEGRTAWWRIAAVILLCVISIAVRWNGLLFWAVIAAALLNGQFVPRFNRQMICAILSMIACLITFLAFRRWLHVDPKTLDPRYDTFLAGAYDIVNWPQNVDELRHRIGLLPGWPAGLLWNLLYSDRIIRSFIACMGMAVLFGWAVTAVRGIRKAQWIWLGMFAQLVVLGFDWPHPMPRYLMPITPLIILAAWMGFEQMIGWLGDAAWWRILIKVGIAGFFASMILSNGAYYALEVFIQRAPNFRQHDEGGVYRQFIAQAKFLKDDAPRNVEIAISQRVVNHQSILVTAGPMRLLHFLSDRPIMLAPVALSNDPDNPSIAEPLAEWAQQNNVRYYLWQPPTKLTYHYRDNGSPAHPRPYTDGDYDWRLYQLIEGKFQRVPVPDVGDWPQKVPGVGD